MASQYFPLITQKVRSSAYVNHKTALLAVCVLVGVAVYVTHNGHLRESKSSSQMTVKLEAAPVSSERGVPRRNFTCGETKIENGSLPEVKQTLTMKQAERAYLRYVGTRNARCAHRGYYGKKRNGGWNMCVDGAFRPTAPCVIYSFGINNDFSFDDAAAGTFGCLVRAFDPSMNRSDFQRSAKVFFYNIGLGGKNHVDKKGWTMRTLQTLLRRFNEEKVIIPYVKFDIEVSEWAVLKNMMDDGSLTNVKQIAFETHVPHRTTVKGLAEYYRTIHRLHEVGFRRWHSFRRGGRFWIQNDQVYVNTNFCQ